MRPRLSAGLIIMSLVVLLDEVVKEGYTFDLSDAFAASVTHEQIFLALLAAGILFGWRSGR